MSMMVTLSVKLAVSVTSSTAAGLLIALTVRKYNEPSSSLSRVTEFSTTTMLSEIENGEAKVDISYSTALFSSESASVVDSTSNKDPSAACSLIVALAISPGNTGGLSFRSMTLIFTMAVAFCVA